MLPRAIKMFWVFRSLCRIRLLWMNMRADAICTRAQVEHDGQSAPDHRLNMKADATCTRAQVEHEGRMQFATELQSRGQGSRLGIVFVACLFSMEFEDEDEEAWQKLVCVCVCV
eukprot:1157479-Pelagomonas_calceolata.AAC.4